MFWLRSFFIMNSTVYPNWKKNELNLSTFFSFEQWNRLKLSTTVLWSQYQQWIMGTSQMNGQCLVCGFCKPWYFFFCCSLVATNSTVFLHFHHVFVSKGGVINFIVASPFLRLIDPMFDLPAMSSPFFFLYSRMYFIHFPHTQFDTGS